jgi:xanthine dehydrogenase molybdopterin-binding subunit B
LSVNEPWFGGQQLESIGLRECIVKAREASGWKERKTEVPVGEDGKSRGLGIAVCGHISGLLGTGAIVRLLEDGTVSLNTGATDIGQGSDTILSQMCAETLQVPIDQIQLSSPDTDGSPFNWGTTASRVTYTTGRAVVGAAKDAADKICQAASEMLDCDLEEMTLMPGGRVGNSSKQGHELTFFDVAKYTHWRSGGQVIGNHTLVYNNQTIDPKRASVTGLPFGQIGVYAFNAMIVDTEIDHYTGAIEVKEAWSATDVGKAINPGLVEGQLEGGFVQGAGWLGCEEVNWKANGEITTHSPSTYKIPAVSDMPEKFNAEIFKKGKNIENVINKSKTTGEPPLMNAMSVFFAIKNAIASIGNYAVNPHLDAPATPEKILMSIKNLKNKI